ncbi:MAG: DUF1573 domain-containing protein [Bacteroidales bacterium]|jgi:hypothetical protein|nr:DUF1573 domain-containing protein [Bacteroidales bacterium]
MKQLFILLSTAFMLHACSSNTNKKEETQQKTQTSVASKTSISFDEETLDLGTLTSGEVVTNTFTFTNTGDNDLLISSIRTSCGCTSTDYSKEPVKPGEKGYVSITFDTKGRRDKQSKTVTVITNTVPQATTLRFVAVIEPESN